MLRGLAPAKVNLALHVTQQRADGYHLLDSLVCFADFGDHISVAEAETLKLEVTGPAGMAVPLGSDNLILRAAALFGADKGACITLDKQLPVASGIGGGSADAAACLRLLAELWQTPLPDPAAVLALGADVPVCLMGQNVRMLGIGERLQPVPQMPKFPAVLVNPGCALATRAVFGAMTQKTNPPLADLPNSDDFTLWLDFLLAQRNDLQSAAITLAPEIATVLDVLARFADCKLARMSGSGATCFGLFETIDQAAQAATALSVDHPEWWVQTTVLG